jgi:hypothetical protein
MTTRLRNVPRGLGLAIPPTPAGMGVAACKTQEQRILLARWLFTIDRGFGSTKVCVPVDQGQYDFGLLDMAVQDATIEKKPEICKAFVERRCQAQRKSERWTKINIAQLQLEQAYHLN